MTHCCASEILTASCGANISQEISIHLVQEEKPQLVIVRYCLNSLATNTISPGETRLDLREEMRLGLRVTFVTANFIAEVPAVVLSITLASAMDTGAVIALELVWAASRTT